MKRQFDASSLLGIGMHDTKPLANPRPGEYVLRLRNFSLEEIWSHPFLHRFVDWNDFDLVEQEVSGDYRLRVVKCSEIDSWRQMGFVVADAYVGLAFALCRYAAGYATAEDTKALQEISQEFMCFDPDGQLCGFMCSHTNRSAGTFQAGLFHPDDDIHGYYHTCLMMCLL